MQLDRASRNPQHCDLSSSKRIHDTRLTSIAIITEWLAKTKAVANYAMDHASSAVLIRCFKYQLRYTSESLMYRMRSKSCRFPEFRTSQCLSQFAAFFLDPRTKAFTIANIEC